MSPVLPARCFSHPSSDMYTVASWHHDRHTSRGKKNLAFLFTQRYVKVPFFLNAVYFLLRFFLCIAILIFGVHPPCWMTLIVGSCWMTSKAPLRIPSDSVYLKAPNTCCWVPFSKTIFCGIDVRSTQRFVIAASVLGNINFVFQSVKSILWSWENLY